MSAVSNRSAHWSVIAAITAFCLMGAGPTARADNPSPNVGEIISHGAAPFTDSFEEMERRDAAIATSDGGGIEQVRSHVRPVDPRFRQDSTASSPPAGRDLSQLDLFASLSPQAISTNFTGITLQDQFTAFGFGSIPPDTMGAIGPNHFAEVINSSVAVYTRTGTRISHVSLDSFFFVQVGGINYPRLGSFDPRVLFDRRSNRWFACALEFGANFDNNHLILAVSRTSSFTGTFDKYLIPIGVPSSGGTDYFTDFDSLGTDDNGVYFGVTIFPYSADPLFAKIAATPKAPLIAAGPSLGVVTQFSNITDLYSTPQPAHNHDAVASDGRAWFVAASNVANANIHYRTLTWIGGTPVLSGASSILTTPAYGPPINAPAMGSTTNINVTDDRIQMAVIRNNRLWTCRHIGVNSGGGATSPDRTGCEWYELNVINPTATLVQSGRVFDNATTNPRFYYFPSIMVTGQGHAVMGFSASKSTEFVHALTCGRLEGDQVGRMGATTTLQAGQGPYQILDGSNRNRWGDYSYTSLDPNDDMSIWTIQEFALTGPNRWGTWIAKLLAPPPATPSSCNPASLTKGTTNADLVVTATSTAGAGFFDPGPSFPNRLSVAIGNSGIVINSVTIDSPTQLTLNVDAPFSTLTGPYTITVTNPDGQAATSSTSIFELLCLATSPVFTQQPVSQTACLNGSATFEAAAQSPTTVAYQWRKDGAAISGATSRTLVLNAIEEEDAGQYDVVVNNECADTTSTAAALQVTHPKIIGQPDALLSQTCDTITFSVVAEGPALLSYQWRRDGQPLTDDDRFIGSQTNKLSISPLARSDIGTYDVAVTTGCGEIISDLAVLSIQGNTNPNDCPQSSGSSALEIGGVPCAQCGTGASSALVLSMAGWGLWRRRSRTRSDRLR